jgi:recombination protein RecA
MTDNKKTDTQKPTKNTPGSERLHAIEELVNSTNKKHGENAVQRLGSDRAKQRLPCIPTGSLSLDQALGVGGYPKGRIVEIFGPESSGKTTLTLHAIAQAQRVGGIAAFIDAEHAFDLRYAKALGVDLDALLVSQPDNGEQALDIAEHLVTSGAVSLVVVDSVAALVPKAEIEGDMGAHHMGLQARLMSQALRKLSGLVSRSETSLIFINQLRQKIGVVFGSPETTTGGQALKYYSSIRLDVRRIGKVQAGDSVVGNRTRVRVIKNKCAPPFMEAEFDIRWGTGIDDRGDLVDLSLGVGVLERAGAHYRFSGKSLGQGRDRVREALGSDAKLCAAIRAKTLHVLAARQLVA